MQQEKGTLQQTLKSLKQLDAGFEVQVIEKVGREQGQIK